MKAIVSIGIALSLLVGFAHAEEATSESLEQWEENIDNLHPKFACYRQGD